jgi:hypothetical protein
MSTTKKKEIKWFGMKLTPAQKAKIKQLAARRGVTQKQAVMDLVNEAVEEKPVKAEPGSFLEAAGDLVGSVEGPSDLSTNPKYMKEYGR